MAQSCYQVVSSTDTKGGNMGTSTRGPASSGNPLNTAQHSIVQSWLNVWKSTVDVTYLADRFQSFIFRPLLAIEHLPNVSLVDSGQIPQFFFSVSYLLPWGFRVLYDIKTMSYKISLDMIKLCSSDRQLNSSKRKITWWKKNWSL